MSLYQYLNRIQRLDALIRRKSTGPPKELAEKLGISERWLYIFLDELKQDLGCPIQYDRCRRSYVYKKPGMVNLQFQEELSLTEKNEVEGGQLKFFIITDCIYLYSNNKYLLISETEQKVS